MLTLLPNTSRLPNVAPYNIFTITYTATTPEGVALPKTFYWWRETSRDCSNENRASLSSNNSIQIVNRNLNESLSTSIITVKEKIVSKWSYCCLFKPALNFFSGVTTEFNCSTAELEFWPLFSFLNIVLRLMYTCTKTECHHFKVMRLFLCSRKCFFL